MDFYKESIVELEAVITEITARLNVIRKYMKINNTRDPIEYIKSRIKSENSMKEKLKRKNIEVNLENALTKVYDAAGIRIICSFIDDVYKVVKMIKQYDDLEIIKEKDYIKNPKENGYRSYHLAIKVPIQITGEIYKVYLEIQIRTIAMDFWSSLEHEMKYKKNVKDQQMIIDEKNNTIYYSLINDSNNKYNPNISYKANTNVKLVVLKNEITSEKIKNNYVFKIMIYDKKEYHIYDLKCTDLPVLNIRYNKSEEISKNNIPMNMYLFDNLSNIPNRIITSNGRIKVDDDNYLLSLHFLTPRKK